MSRSERVLPPLSPVGSPSTLIYGALSENTHYPWRSPSSPRSSSSSRRSKISPSPGFSLRRKAPKKQTANPQPDEQPEELLQPSIMAHICPKILHGIKCHRSCNADGTSETPGNLRGGVVGYMRLIAPTCSDFVKSRPLLEPSTVQGIEEDDGIEVIHRNQFVVWNKEAALRVALVFPGSMDATQLDVFNLTIEVGVLTADDAAIPLGSALISLDIGSFGKKRFLLNPKHEVRSKPDRAGIDHDGCDIYRLDEEAALTVEVMMLENITTDAQPWEAFKKSQANRHPLWRALAARIGQHNNNRSNNDNIKDNNNLVESKQKDSDETLSNDPKATDQTPLPQCSSSGSLSDRQSDSEEGRSRLPGVEMTSFSTGTYSTMKEEEIAINLASCFLLPGNDRSEDELGMGNPSDSSSTTSEDSFLSRLSSGVDKDIEQIVKKRTTRNKAQKAQKIEPCSFPTDESVDSGIVDMPATKEAKRKNTFKHKVKRMLEFQKRKLEKSILKETREQPECEEDSLVNRRSSHTLNGLRLPCNSTINEYDLSEAFCPPFTKTGIGPICTKLMKRDSVTTDQDSAILLSRHKVKKLATALNITPSLLTKEIEQLNE